MEVPNAATRIIVAIITVVSSSEQNSQIQFTIGMYTWPWIVSEVYIMRKLGKNFQMQKNAGMREDTTYGGKPFMFTSCWTKLNVAVIIAWEAIN